MSRPTVVNSVLTLGVDFCNFGVVLGKFDKIVFFHVLVTFESYVVNVEATLLKLDRTLATLVQL